MIIQMISSAQEPAVALRWDGLIAVNYAARAHGVKCACPVKPALL
jgi:nucleotidyltransferase/DNA polymerase involved in DNA repair